jgi:anti-sigma factor RsiW
LISAYLDHQLTPKQMHMVEDHLAFCARCDEEYQAVRDAKYALRSLASRTPDELAFRIAARLHSEGARAHGLYAHPPLPPSVIATRRTFTAVAFSCVCLFLVAGPFSPATVERYQSWRNAQFPRSSNPFGMPIPVRDALFPGISPFRTMFQDNRPRRSVRVVPVHSSVTYAWGSFAAQPLSPSAAQPSYQVRMANDLDTGFLP